LPSSLPNPIKRILSIYGFSAESKVQMRTLARAGRVTYSRIDRLHWRFAKRDLDAYIARNTFKARSVFEGGK